MHRIALFIGIVCVALALPGTVSAAGISQHGTAVAEPPIRPLELTETQFEALVHLESQPHHADVLGVRASYSSEHERRMEFNRVVNNIAHVGYHAAFAGLILTFLIVGL